MRIKKTKALRYVVATFLTMGTVLSVGFLSFSGLWLIYPYIIPAILAFFLSGVIEGKVFGTSIFKGLARLKLLTSNAEKHLFFSELNKFLENEAFQSKFKCDFLDDYGKQRTKYKALKNNPNAKQEEIAKAKKELENLKDFFYQQLNETNVKNNAAYVSQTLKTASLIELHSAKRSVWFLRFFWIISILVGIVSGFVTAFAVQEAITVGLALSLSATALSAIVWPVAIFAAIGSTFLLYNAITDIVKKDAISKACSKTLTLFKRNPHESISAYLFRLLALSLVIVGITSLTVFATAASGGTCWIVMQKGIKLLAPKLPIFVAYCASTILIPINFVTDLIYGFSTTLQTIDNCKNIFIAIFEGIKHPVNAIKSFCSNVKRALNEVKEKESWAQFFNPFRILAKLVISPLQTLVFIGHLISIGFTADRFLNFPPLLVAIVGAGSEGVSDLSYFTKEADHSDEHRHGHEANDGHDHDHGNLLQLPLQALLSPLLITVAILYWAVKKCGNEVSFFDAVTEIFMLPLLNIVFFPLLLPSAIWHRAFRKRGNNLTFFDSIKKSFDIHTHDEHTTEQPKTPKELSEKWLKEERVDWILSKAIKHLDGTCCDKNIAAEKQNKLKLLASHREGIIKFFIENREEIPNLSFENAVEMYFKNDALKEKLANAISEYFNGGPKEKLNRSTTAYIDDKLIKSHGENGHINGNNNSQEQQSSCFKIFEDRRGFFSFNKSKPTTTETHVKNAFSLAITA